MIARVLDATLDIMGGVLDKALDMAGRVLDRTLSIVVRVMVTVLDILGWGLAHPRSKQCRIYLMWRLGEFLPEKQFREKSSKNRAIGAIAALFNSVTATRTHMP